MSTVLKYPDIPVDSQGSSTAGSHDPAASTVASFVIRYRRFLDETGEAVAPLPAFAKDRDALIRLYRAMRLTRTFDAKAITMQRTGQLRTYPSCQGQEAVGVGVASAMTDDDVLFPTYREQSAQLWRGVTMVELLQFWGGDGRGSDFATPRQDFPISITIASHALHATGVATAMKLRGESRAAICMLGDGATSKGDFYEALNVAGVWNLPVVFVVTNNQWAISLPRSAQSAAKTLAQKAIAAGFGGEQVDGNDVIAVHQAAADALARARAGEGPFLIEALTYRLGDHTTADNADRYRDAEEVSAQWRNEPLVRLRNYLDAQGWWSKTDEEQLLAEAMTEVEAAQDTFLALTPEPPAAIFDHCHATWPSSLDTQRRLILGDENG